jgi:hypothetical protein
MATLVQFSAPTSGASGLFPGGAATVNVVTDSLGRATAPQFTANSILGFYSVTAFVAGASPAVFGITNINNLLFSDGFESGSLSNWSSHTPP